MIARAPHVRVEMRRVYVSARGAKLTKHAAYVGAAKHLIAEKCGCIHEPRTDTYGGYSFDCHYRAPCCNDAETCTHAFRMPVFCKVLPRLVRFLKFVDKRIAPEPMTIAQLRKRGFKPHGLQP